MRRACARACTSAACRWPEIGALARRKALAKKIGVLCTVEHSRKRVVAYPRLRILETPLLILFLEVSRKEKENFSNNVGSPSVVLEESAL